jgi:UDP-N-acetylmuramoyl-tripeptide--D-alanyl-D-alanine ligase
MIAHLLGMRYTLYKTPGNYNTLISVPTEIINIPFGVPVAVFEVALHEIGDVDILGSIIKPSVAVITRIDAEHLEYLESVDVVKRENLKILKHLRTDGWAVIPSSVAHDVQDMYSSASQTFITFGSGNYVDVSARSVRVTWQGTSFTISAFGETKRFHIPIIGAHYVTSVMATVSVGLIFEFTLSAIESRLRSFEPVWGRMDVRFVGDKKIIFDAYNASPASMEEFLKTVGVLRSGERLMLVLGDMKELGKYSGDYHLKLVPQIRDIRPEYLVLVGPEMRIVYEELKNGGYKGKLVHADSVDEVFDFVSANLSDCTFIAFKASRSMKLETLLQQVVMSGEPAPDE